MDQREQTGSGVRSRMTLPAVWWRTLGILWILYCVAAAPLRAQTNSTPQYSFFTLMYDFCQINNCPDGSRPYAGLVQGLDGNFYGTTEYGGILTCNGGCGTVFMITPYGALTELYEFCSLASCADGANPTAELTLGTDGNFYGTTVNNGTGGGGTVFRITPAGELSTLYSFCQFSNCTDGDQPWGGLVQAIDGNFYGTTTFGGAAVGSSGGTVFKITPSGKLTTLYSFCVNTGCADGANPHGTLIQATDGNFYGTTYGGGANQVHGAVFKINPRGPMTTMYSFCSQANCADGQEPIAGLLQASDGNFYGTTVYGGANGNLGTIFKVTPSGALTTLYSFSGSGDGNYPYGALIQGTDGKLYGMTNQGGQNGCGEVFVMPLGGTPLSYDFCVYAANGSLGTNPLSTPLQGTDGTFYGTASGGGNNTGNGTVFSFAPGQGAFLKASPNFGRVGATIAILGTGLTTASSVTFNGTSATFEVASDSEIVATIPAGATTGEISADTHWGMLSSAVNFKVLPPVTVIGLTTNFAGGAAGDVAVWRADTGSWYMKPASGAPPVTVFQGLPGDIPVVGDYDGDGKSDYGVWRPSNGTFYIILSSTGKTITQPWGTTGDVPVPSDYDGDGKTDFAVWRPSNATWYIIPSGGGPDITYPWGLTDDVPVVGDYDGDGKADFAVWNPATGTWSVSLSGGGTLTQAWGTAGDIPVEADYDGDGMTDFAVWRPSTGWWYIMPSSGIAEIAQQWGTTGDIPVIGDYNGDGKSDFAVWRPSNGTWYINYSSGGTKTEPWGATGDVPATHLPLMYRRDKHTPNFDGDRKADVEVFRPSNGTWYTILSSTGKTTRQPWGASSDIIVPGDYDGDGKTDYAIFRPSTGTWWVVLSSTGKIVSQAWGMSGDIPVPGDYDGDGKTDYAIWRPSTGTWWVLLSSTGKTVSQPFGVSGDIPVPGDYDGDGKTDYAVWRPSSATFYVILSSTGQSVNQQWGLNGDKPVPGDYDGDGRTDYAVWRPSNGTFYVILSSTGKTVSQLWGTSGDVPVPKDYDGDGVTDFAVWRPSNGTWYIINSSTGKSTATPWGTSTDVPLSKPTGQ